MIERSASCGNGINCPALHRREDGRLIASGPTVTDPDILRELALPDHESAVEFAEQLLSGPQPTLLDLDGLAAYIDQHHTRDLFRLETLPSYAVGSDGDDYRRYMQNEPTPNADAKQPWLDRLHRDVSAGRKWRRVHAVTLPLSDYLRYEAEWCYTFNVAAGENVRIFDAATEAIMRVGDFFVLDDEHVVRSIYEPDGRFTGAEVVHGPDKVLYLAIRDLIWDWSSSFTSWWRRHPEFHRSNRAA